jgi:DNA-binding transcriptional LysR family regulator
MPSWQYIFSIGEIMKVDKIPVWESFQAVATHGGFSNAARVLRISVPQLSKRIARLEESLGTRLFH